MIPKTICLYGTMDEKTVAGMEAITHQEDELPAISFGGINTGLPPNLVDQLIKAERIPIQSLETRKEKSESRLNLVTELEGRVRNIAGGIRELANTRGFSDVKLVSADPNIVQGVVDPELATPGSWNIEVVQLAQKPSAITNGFPDKDVTEVGVGYVSFDTPEGSKEVYIDGSNNTLEGVARQINRSNTGLRATIINDRKDPDNPFKLVVSGNEVGQDNQVSYPTLYFLDGDRDFYFAETKKAGNGIVKIDGFEVEVPDNTIEDYIPGVTIELKQAAPGRTINLTVKEDLEVVSGKVKNFVDSMNEVFAFIQQQNRIDANTDTSRTLGGDNLLRSIETRFRRLVQGQMYGVNSRFKTIGEIGIEFNRSGLLDFDQKKFDSQLAQSPLDVQNFFVGNGFSTGFIHRLRSTVDAVVNQAFGPLAIRKKGLQSKIRQMDQRIDDKERQLAKKEVSLRQKFARLEETMSRLKSQGAAVSRMGGGNILDGMKLQQS